MTFHRHSSASFADPIPAVAPDHQVRILSVIEEAGGTADIREIAACLADTPWPVAVILALVEAGLLTIDRSAPLDACTQVWRTQR